MLHSEQTRVNIEKTGSSFELQGLVRAQSKTWDAIENIRAKIRVGMTEDEGQRIANETLDSMGAVKKWHRCWVRFGPNTTLPYGVPSQPEVILQANDLFFIDIGPVWDGYEGDAGATFTVGADLEYEKIAGDAKLLWKLVRDRWNFGESTGAALYDFALSEAKKLGWDLSLNQANGHRISDFPHKIYSKESIASLGFSPASHLWVLEIQIKHPTKNFGAFYEDLLY